MYLIDAFLIILLIYSVAKSFLVSSKKMLKKMLASILAILFVYPLFYFKEINKVFESIFKIMQDVIDKLVDYDPTIFKANVLANDFILPLFAFIIFLIFFYFVSYLLISLIIKKKSVEKKLLKKHRRTNYVFNVFCSLVIFAIFSYILMEVLVIATAGSTFDVDMFGYLFKEYGKLDDFYVAELLERVFDHLPGGVV